MKMKNKDEVKNNIKSYSLKGEDLKKEIAEILKQMNQCKELDYDDVVTLQNLNKILLDKIQLLRLTENSVIMMKWTHGKLEE
jgi:transcriptional regulator of heat shock response